MACVNAATGWRYTVAELMLLGERRINLCRSYNIREGFGPGDDDLPARIFDEGLVDEGAGKGLNVDRREFSAARRAYYSLNGWDPESGHPSETKLSELGIEWAAENLEARA